MRYLRSAVRDYALKYGLSETEVEAQLRQKDPTVEFEDNAAPTTPESSSFDIPEQSPDTTETDFTKSAPMGMDAAAAPVERGGSFGNISDSIIRGAKTFARDPLTAIDELTTGVGGELIEGGKQAHRSVMRQQQALDTLTGIPEFNQQDSFKPPIDPVNPDEVLSTEEIRQRRVDEIGAPEPSSDMPLSEALYTNADILDDPRYLARWVRKAFTQQIPIMGSIMAASRVNPLLGLAAGGMMEGGSNFEQMLVEDVKTGKASREEAALAATLSGLLSGGLESVLPAKIGAKIHSSIFKVAREEAKKLTKLGLLKEIGKDMGTEGVTEYLQTSIGSAVRAIYDSEQSVLKAFWPNYENMEAALTGTFVSGGLSGPVTVATNVSQTGRMEDRDLDADADLAEQGSEDRDLDADVESMVQEGEDRDLDEMAGIDEETAIVSASEMAALERAIMLSDSAPHIEKKDILLESAAQNVAKYRGVLAEVQTARKTIRERKAAEKEAHRMVEVGEVKPDMDMASVEQRVKESRRRKTNRDAGLNAETGQESIRTTDTPVVDPEPSEGAKTAFPQPYAPRVELGDVNPMEYADSIIEDIRAAQTPSDLRQVTYALADVREAAKGGKDKQALAEIDEAMTARRAEMQEQEAEAIKASELQQSQKESFKPDEKKKAGDAGTMKYQVDETDRDILTRDTDEYRAEIDRVVKERGLDYEDARNAVDDRMAGDPLFRSGVYEALEAKMPNRATPEQVLGILFKVKNGKEQYAPNVKQEEIRDLDVVNLIKEMTNEDGKVVKSEVLKALELQIGEKLNSSEEVHRSENASEGYLVYSSREDNEPTAYRTREEALQAADSDAAYIEWDENAFGEDGGRFYRGITMTGTAKGEYIVGRTHMPTERPQRGHFGKEVTHDRSSIEQTDSKEPVYLLQEIQSDSHQQAAKVRGEEVSRKIFDLVYADTENIILNGFNKRMVVRTDNDKQTYANAYRRKFPDAYDAVRTSVEPSIPTDFGYSGSGREAQETWNKRLSELQGAQTARDTALNEVYAKGRDELKRISENTGNSQNDLLRLGMPDDINGNGLTPLQRSAYHLSLAIETSGGDMELVGQLREEVTKAAESYSQILKHRENTPIAGVGDIPMKKSWPEFTFKRLLDRAVRSDAKYLAYFKTYEQLAIMEGWMTKGEDIGPVMEQRGPILRRAIDQLPRFADKYIKKIDPDARPRPITLENGAEVWGIPLTQKLRDSILNEGQYIYQSQKKRFRPTDTKGLTKDQIERLTEIGEAAGFPAEIINMSKHLKVRFGPVLRIVSKTPSDSRGHQNAINETKQAVRVALAKQYAEDLANAEAEEKVQSERNPAARVAHSPAQSTSGRLRRGSAGEANRVYTAWQNKQAVDGHVALYGEDVGTIDKVAVAAQIMRDPRHEHLRIVVYDKDTGEVLSVESYTSRDPASVSTDILGIGAPQNPTADQLTKVHARNGYKLRDKISRIRSRSSNGNLGVYVLHNHPDGDSTPSPADIAQTPRLAKIFTREGVEYGGHVVINSNEYSVINENGSELFDLSTGESLAEFDADENIIVGDMEALQARRNEMRFHDPVLTDQSLPDEQRRIVIGGTNSVANLGVGLKTPRDWLTLMSADAENRMTAARQVHRNEIGTPAFQAMLDNWASETGGRDIIAYYGGGDAPTLAKVTELVDARSINDLIFDEADPKSLRKSLGMANDDETIYGRAARKKVREFRLEQRKKASQKVVTNIANIIVDRRVKQSIRKNLTGAKQDILDREFDDSDVKNDAVQRREALRQGGTDKIDKYPPFAEKEIGAEELLGGILIPFMADRLRADGKLERVRGQDVVGDPLVQDGEVLLQGGEDYPLLMQHFFPDTDIVWSSEVSVTKKMRKGILQVFNKYDGKRKVYGAPYAMESKGITYTAATAQAMIGIMKTLQPDQKAIDQLNKQVREKYPKFLGVMHPEVALQIYGLGNYPFKGAGAIRKHMVEVMSKAEYRKQGFAIFDDVAKAITKSDLMDVLRGDMGGVIFEITPDGDHIGDSQHMTYDGVVRGKYKGKLKKRLPAKVAFGERYKKKGKSADHKTMRSFDISGAQMNYEPVDDAWLELAETFWEMDEMDQKQVIELGLLRQTQKASFDPDADTDSDESSPMYKGILVAKPDLDYNSGKTDINYKSNRMPAMSKVVADAEWGGWGKRNLDFGGGKGELVTEHLRGLGVTNAVFDAFNRPRKRNEALIDRSEKSPFDTASLFNVLNTIREPAIRLDVLRAVSRMTKQDGKIYIQVYYDSSDIKKRAAKGLPPEGFRGDENDPSWQEMRRAETYLDEIRQVFPDAEKVSGGEYIVATNTQKGSEQVTPNLQQTQKARFNPDNEDYLEPEDPQRAENFTNWFKESKALDDNGEPLRLYSGTFKDYDAYDPNIGNKDNYVGAGFYATDAPADASENYANLDGPDPSERIKVEVERRMRELDDEGDLDYDADQIEEEVKAEWGNPNVMPVYMSIQNPLVLSLGKDKTFFDYSFDVTPERRQEIEMEVRDEMVDELAEFGEDIDQWGISARSDLNDAVQDRVYEEAEETGALIELREAIIDAASNYDADGDVTEAVTDAMQDGFDFMGLSGTEVFENLRNQNTMLYDQTTGDSIGWGQILREAAESLGYDGFIVDTNTTHFNNMPNIGQRHYIAFRPNQIKSVTGNNGQYSEDNSMLKQSQKAQFNPDAGEDFIPVGDPRRDENLKRHLGDSIIKEPLFHGSPHEFEQFKQDELWGDLGFHFGSQGQAQEFALRKASRDGISNRNTMKLWVRLENPLVVKDLGRWDASDIAQQLVEQRPDLDPIPADVLWMNHHEFRDYLKGLGYDGFSYLNRHEDLRAARDFQWDQGDWNNRGKKDIPKGSSVDAFTAQLMLEQEFGRGNSGSIRRMSSYTNEEFASVIASEQSYAVFDPNQLKSATGNSGQYSEDPRLIKQSQKASFDPDESPMDRLRRKIAERRGVTEVAGVNVDTGEKVEPKPRAVGQKERSFPKTAEKAGRPAGDNLYYQPITNDEDLEAAIQAVVGDPEAVWDDLRNRSNVDGVNPSTASTHTAQGVALVAYYEGLASSAATEEEADRYRSRALNVAGEVSSHLTKAGQEVQAAKLVMSVSPETILIKAQQAVQRINESRSAAEKKKDPVGKVISKEEHAKIRQLARDAQAWNDLGVDVKNISRTMKKMLDGEALTAADSARIKKIADHIGATLGDVDTKDRRSNVRKIMDTRVDAMEQRARDYLAQKGITLGSGIPVDMLAAYAGIGASKLYKGTTKFTDWVTEMKTTLPDNEFDNKAWRKVYQESWLTLRKEQKRGRRMASRAKMISDIISRVETDPDVSELPNYEALALAAQELQNMAGEAQMEAAQELALGIRQLDKPDLSQRLSTAQTMSHLFNPVTMIRNIVGNELHWRFDRMAKYVASPVDWTVSKVTGKDRQITFKGGDQGQYWKDLITGGKIAWKGGNPAGLETQYGLRAPAFNGKWNPLTYIEKSMGVALRGFDYAAYKRAYNVSLAEMAHLAAMNKGVPRGELKAFVANWMANADENVMETADEYGKRITFQDDSTLSKGAVATKKFLNQVPLVPFLNRKADPATGELAFGVGDLILKYPKTPSNLFDRAIDYSPLGFVRAAFQMAPFWQSENPDPTKWGMTLARAFVGSGSAAFAALLYDAGALTGDDDDDWDAANLQFQQTGVTKYQINTTALVRYATEGLNPKDLKKQDGDLFVNYNWALPMSIPLAMGADFMQGYNEQVTLGNVGDAVGGAAESTFEAFGEMPMLQSLGHIFKGTGYSDNSLGQIAENLLKEFETIPSQMITPTLLYQIRKSIDGESRITDAPSDFLPDFVPSPAHRAMNKVINRLPFISKTLPKMYKTFGIKQPKTVYSEGQNTLFNIFVNPAFTSRYKEASDVAAILAPYESELRKGQFPRSISRKYAIGGVSVELRPEDRSKMQEMLASATTKNFRALLNAGAMSGATPEEQMDRFVKGWKRSKAGRQYEGLNAAAEEVRKWFVEHRLKDYKDQMNARQLTTVNKYEANFRKRNR